MTVYDVYRLIDGRFPFDSAAEYDNVGLLVGDMNATVKRALVTLDCTKAAAEKAVELGATLIITHHPVIFDPLKSVTADSVVHFCIQHGISVISAHTNVDMGQDGINDKLCEMLSLLEVEPLMADGFMLRRGVLPSPLTAAELAKCCETLFSIPVRFTDGGKKIKTVAVCSGSGGSMLDSVMPHADAFVTSDVKHSQFIAAANNGFSVFDCGHFNTEDVIVEPIKNLLCENLPEIEFFAFHGKEILNTCDFGGNV